MSSPPLSIELQPSPWLGVLLLALAALVPAAWAEADPPSWLWALLPLAWITTLRTWRSLARGTLQLRADGSAAWHDGGAGEGEAVELEHVDVAQRGPLWTFCLHAGGQVRRACVLLHSRRDPRARLLRLWEAQRAEREVPHV